MHSQGSAYEACDRTRTPSHTPKVSKACDKLHAIICKKGNEVCDIYDFHMPKPA